MSDTVGFDEEEARREEATYETPAAVERRRFVRNTLDPQPDDEVLSIGCGPGFEPAELAGVVGADGRVFGVDRSDAMLALAAHRCNNLLNTTLARADAAALPVRNASFDRAVAVQVYEYVENVGAALDQLSRVLRPGGRAVVYDTDFDSLVWRSSDRDRMDRVLDAWDDHCPHPDLGSQLAPHLREAGLMIDRVEPNTVLNTRLDDTFATHLLEFLREYAADHDAIGPEEANKWAEDLYELDAANETFFSLTQYLYAVRKPA